MSNYRMLTGAVATLAALALAASFQFADHGWYWDLAPLYTILGLVAAGSGGFLLFDSMQSATGNRRMLLCLGAVLGLVWLAAGLAAFALSFPSMNYLQGWEGSVNWDTYQGDYMVGLFQLRLLQAGIVVGLAGGMLLGRGTRRKGAGLT